MITEEQYRLYKALIAEYEASLIEEEEDDYYEDDDEYDPLQREFEECHCGAYQLSKSGKIIHVADCCC